MSAAWQPFKALFAPSDEQLMWRVQAQDDAAAFADLVGRWEDPIHRLCTRLCGDAHRAEDLAQEIFAKVFARRHAFAADRKFSTWLWRVALNHCYNDLRRARSRPESRFGGGQEDDVSAGPDDFSADQPGPDEELVGRETAAAVQAALATLSEEHRSIVVLRHYEGLKFREIAEVLDLPEGTVKTRMTEALNELARRLRRSLQLNVPPRPERRARPREALIL